MRWRPLKRWMAAATSLAMFLSAALPIAAADEPGEQKMIDIGASSGWQGSVFGNVGGQSNIHADFFTIRENAADNSVTMRVYGDKGKIDSSSDGIAYYFREVPTDANFELTATAHVDTWTAHNQVAFGLMLRNNVFDNVADTAEQKYFGDYVAVGALDQKMKGFQRLDGKLAKSGSGYDFANVAAPATGKSYDLSIKKTGGLYQLKIGDETNTITDFSGTVAYAGLFAVRSTQVTFSNVKLKIEGEIELGDWVFSAFGPGISASKNPTPDENDQGVTLTASSNGGKIASSDEGISYYYKELPANANFEISAKAAVQSYGGDNQTSFGVMLREGVGASGSTASEKSAYVAAGALGASMQAFYRENNKSRIGLAEYANADKPASNETYDLKIKKSGPSYVMTVGRESQTVTLDTWGGEHIYAGVYVAREAVVTFSDVTIRVDSRKVTGLEIDSSAMKTSYLKGESLDTAGLKVMALFDDNSRTLLGPDDYIVTGFNSDEPGTVAISINYNGVSQTMDVTISALTVTSLAIRYYPAKTSYYPGDLFDPKGLTVVADYNDGYMREQQLTEDQYTIAIQGAVISGDTFRLDAAGRYEVKVISIETPSQSVSFDIDVLEAALTGLEIRQQPQKQVYYLGDELDLDGIAIYAGYSDGKSVRLLKEEYSLSALDTTTAGVKTVTISHKGQSVQLELTVKQRELTGITVTGFPQTTYEVGQAFDPAGLAVSKVYDNGDRELLAAADHTLDTGAYNSAAAGTYGIRIVPADTGLAPITLHVTVREKAEPVWRTIRFGQSSSAANNTATVQFEQDGKTLRSARLVALEGGGKVTGDHDGITFVYTEIDAARDNFVLSADIAVEAYAKPNHDGQESFGLMARDAIGKAGDSSVFASNIAAVGGYSGGTRNDNGTQLFIRTGVESPDGAGSQGIRNIMLKNERPGPGNTHPAAPYRLTLAKTNSGYWAKLNDGKEEIFYEPDMLNVQDGKIYVGFYTARLATIEVSNVSFQVTEAATDAPRVEPPKVPVEPGLDIVSLDKTPLTDYVLRVKANVDGVVTVKRGQQVIASDTAVEAGKTAEFPAVLTANGQSNFSVAFLPDDTQLLTSYDKLVRNFTVTNRSYVPGGDIHVSTTGTAEGDGTVERPLDLDTAVEYVRPGQSIIVQAGNYVRSSKLEIRKYNDGAAGALKSLVAAPGARPVIDFGKKSEGVVLSGNYWHVRGLDFARSAGNTKGFTIGGSHNIVENSRFYEHGDTGLQISRTDDSNDKSLWPSYNLILNSTSFDNRDPSDNNADGFAAKLTSGVGNVFRGAIAHNNIDDGWDLYTKAGTGAIGAVVIEDSIAYNNGFLTDGTVGQGDKNGFKLGGEGIHVPHIIRNSIAFGNGAYGFTSNSNPGVIAENNIGFDNAKGNLGFTTYANIAEDFRIDGFVSYQKSYTARDSYPAALNSDSNFMFNGTDSVNKSGVKLTDDNFASLEPVLPYARDEQGHILRGDFLKFIAPKTDTPDGGNNNNTGGGWIPSAPGHTVKEIEEGVSMSVEPTRETSGGRTTAAVKLTATSLDQAVQALAAHGGRTLAIAVTGGDAAAADAADAVRVTVPADALAKAREKVPGVLLTVRSGGVEYELPVDALNLQGLAEQLGVQQVDIEISITMAVATGSEEVAAGFEQALSELGGATLVSVPIEFRITASGGGHSAEVSDFGGTYIARTVTLAQSVDAARTTAVLYDPQTGKLSFVPAVFTEQDGVTRVTMKRPGNSVYAVAEFDRTFADLAGHWARGDVELLASKLVVDGMNDTAYAPEQLITRAQFAALLVRSLGLPERASAAEAFTDAASSSWYAGAVGAAVQAGLIEGYEDGTFRPDAEITREQMAAMIARALAAAGKPGQAAAAALDRFADQAAISAWAREAAAQAASAGIVDGMADGTFAPGEHATRAQAAAMLKRLLVYVQFIND